MVLTILPDYQLTLIMPNSFLSPPPPPPPPQKKKKKMYSHLLLFLKTVIEKAETIEIIPLRR